MSSSRITLTGLDGANPLAFLAALGVLRVLHHRARQHARRSPRLSWIDEGCWRPVIHGAASIEAIIGEILEDRATWSEDPALLFAYDETGERLLDPRRKGSECIRDLKPKPSTTRSFLEGLASRAAGEWTWAEQLGLRRTMDMAVAYGSEFVQDNNGNTKPTAFHFTAGQQQFMKGVSELQAKVTTSDFEEALVGPWLRESTLPNMGWDATNARLYALRATNPSGDKKTTVAGADWLAFVGLGAFPCFPVGSRLATTAIEGGWKESDLTWALWRGAATQQEASSIVRTQGLAQLTAAARRARGIIGVFRARILRSDQGGYGSFAPAAVL